MSSDGYGIAQLTKELSEFSALVVSDESEGLFERISHELPLRIHRFGSGDVHNGWTVPHNWSVRKATISSGRKVLFDGTAHTLGVAMYSKSFRGSLSYGELRRHVVVHDKLPDAYVFHCMWQYRPWQADWALSVPQSLWSSFSEEATYDVELETLYEHGEMLVGEYTHTGASEKTIVFNAHTCHPHQANDAMVGVATLVRLFQWMKGRATRYTYKLILAPEHLGTVFYLRDRSLAEVEQMVGGIYAEMLGTEHPVKATSTFLGGQAIDRVVGHVLKHYTKASVQVGWRQGAGNDETVWEAPGYEVPFVELTRAFSLWEPYPQYHTSLDTVESLNMSHVEEVFEALQRVVTVLEEDVRISRHFDGIVCLSNPQYDLYIERPDPAVAKVCKVDSEKWGYLIDCILRYFDGSMSALDIADKHDIPFDQLLEYLKRFEEKGLVSLHPVQISRPKASRAEVV